MASTSLTNPLSHRQILVGPFELARNLVRDRAAISPQPSQRAIPTERVAAALDEPRARGFVAGDETDANKRTKLTSSGCEVLDRLVSARRAHLAELAAEWDPSQQKDVGEYLRSAVRDLVPEARRAN